MALLFNSVFVFLISLFGLFDIVCLVRWGKFDAGCYTGVGRLRATDVHSLSHCTTECFVNERCEVFGYAPSDQTCYLYDESYSAPTTKSCSHTVSYYRATCGESTTYTYVKSLKKCISYKSDYQLDWEDASNDCKKDGGHLAHVTTQGLLDYIKSHRETTNTKYWIGGIESAAGSNTYEWSSGETIDTSNGGQLWLSDRPKAYFGAQRKCIEVKYASEKNEYGLFDRQCNYTRKFFCEIDKF